MSFASFSARGFIFSLFPAQLLQFSLLFDCPSRRTLQLRACLAWHEKKRSEVSDAPSHTAHLLGAVIHTFPCLGTAAGHLCAFLSLVGLALPHLLSILLCILPCFPFQDSIYEGSKLTKALFFVIDQVHFESDSVRALGPVEPCSTFHTVSTKSYKKDWLWEVWHESWLHNMKSY